MGRGGCGASGGFRAFSFLKAPLSGVWDLGYRALGLALKPGCRKGLFQGCVGCFVGAFRGLGSKTVQLSIHGLEKVALIVRAGFLP